MDADEAHSPTLTDASSTVTGSRRSRPNTPEEKRLMRNKRKTLRRKRGGIINSYRKKVDELKQVVRSERSLRERIDLKAMYFKNMSKSFWEKVELGNFKKDSISSVLV